MAVMNPLTPKVAAQALSTIEDSFKLLDKQVKRAGGDLLLEVIERKNVETILASEVEAHQGTQKALTSEQDAHTETKKTLSQEQGAHTQTKDALLQEQQGHIQTKEALAQEQQAHSQTKIDLSQEQHAHAQTQNALSNEQQAHALTKGALTQEQQAHAQTQNGLAQEQQLHAQARAAHNAEVQSHAQTKATLSAEQSAHAQTQAQYDRLLLQSRQQLAEALQIVARTFPARNGSAVLELDLAQGILTWSQPTNITPQVARDHQLSLPPHAQAVVSVELPDGTDGDIIKLMELVGLAKDFAEAERLESEPLSEKVAGAVLGAGSVLQLQYLYGSRVNVMLDRCEQNARIHSLVLEQSAFTASGEFVLSGYRAKDCVTLINHPRVEFKDTRIKRGILDGFMVDAIIHQDSYIRTDLRHADLERADWRAYGTTAAEREADLRVRHGGSVVPLGRTSSSLLKVVRQLSLPESARIDELRNQAVSGGALINTFSSALCMRPQVSQAAAASDPELFRHPELSLQNCSAARIARLVLPSGMTLLVAVPDDEKLNPVIFDMSCLNYQAMSTVFASKDRPSIWLAAARLYLGRSLQSLNGQALGSVGVP